MQNKIILKYIDVVLIRLTKLIANYYQHAGIRTLYFEKLGVYIGENTDANLGMKIIIEKFKTSSVITLR